MPLKVEVYKKSSGIILYKDLEQPTAIFKEYYVDGERHESTAELRIMRKKLISIKNCLYWPEFIIKPKIVSKINKQSFLAKFPFIDGQTLEQYLLENNMDLVTCANLISSIEKYIMKENRFVFPDIANSGNIMIMPSEDEKLHFHIIDPDDVLFENHELDRYANSLGLFLNNGDWGIGVKKCFNQIDSGIANKQLDIRSMYALFYMMLNANTKNNMGLFYPYNCEESIEMCHYLLSQIQIPDGSLLYKNYIKTLEETEPNQPITSALNELIEENYYFEKYGQNQYGSQYRLAKNKIY